MQENTNLQKTSQSIVFNIEKFLNSVDRINCQIDEICNQIRETIRDFLTEWKNFSQKTDKEKLIKLWEELGMHVDDEDSDDPIFWFPSYAKMSTEERDITVSLYVKRGDDVLYADEELPEISSTVESGGKEEYRINLYQCNFNSLTEIMDTIYYSLNLANIKMKTLQNTSRKKLKNF